MKLLYALVSDIHANYFALESAIGVIKKRKADKILVAGDICGKGPNPFDVLEILKSSKCIAVKGNSDIKFLSSRIAKESLSSRQKKLIKWLASLPAISLVDEKILLCHGSPLNITDYIYPSITKGALLKKISGYESKTRIVATGHSHIPFVKRIGKILVVNGGSVGKPIDGDPRGSLAFIRADGNSLKGEIVRFDYNIEALVNILRKMDYSKKTIDSYKKGLRNGRG